MCGSRQAGLAIDVCCIVISLEVSLAATALTPASAYRCNSSSTLMAGLGVTQHYSGSPATSSLILIVTHLPHLLHETHACPAPADNSPGNSSSDLDTGLGDVQRQQQQWSEERDGLLAQLSQLKRQLSAAAADSPHLTAFLHKAPASPQRRPGSGLGSGAARGSTGASIGRRGHHAASEDHGRGGLGEGAAWNGFSPASHTPGIGYADLSPSPTRRGDPAGSARLGLRHGGSPGIWQPEFDDAGASGQSWRPQGVGAGRQGTTSAQGAGSPLRQGLGGLPQETPKTQRMRLMEAKAEELEKVGLVSAVKPPSCLVDAAELEIIQSSLQMGVALAISLHSCHGGHTVEVEAVERVLDAFTGSSASQV